VGLIVVALAVAAVALAGAWRAFEKAGAPGWAVVIPIYNLFVLVKMAGKEGWWVILFFVPIVFFFVPFIVAIEIAKNFGQPAAFGFGLVLLGAVFWPILGFGDAEWEVAPVNV
jgi:hypothetical protein